METLLTGESDRLIIKAFLAGIALAKPWLA
jgi:hypothetical protein